MNEYERQQQEYEYVMEGITTRMQIALEKMSESNHMMADNTRRVCQMMIAVVIIVVLGFVVNNIIMINHINDIRGGVAAHETVSQLGPGPGD